MTHSLDTIISYMEATPEESWCTEVVKTAVTDGKNCFFGHLFDMGGSDREGSRIWDHFEEQFATTYMLYPVNDGRHPDYPQTTPKQRVLAYLRDLRAGAKPTTLQLMDLMEAPERDAEMGV